MKMNILKMLCNAGMILLALLLIFACVSCDSGNTPQAGTDTVPEGLGTASSSGMAEDPAGTTKESEVTTKAPETTACLHENTRETVLKAATCTQSGVIQRVCVACGEKLPEEAVPPTGHHFEKKAEESPSCLWEGHLYEKCRDCEETRHTYTDMVGHKFGADGICEWCMTTSSGFMFRKNADGESYTFTGAGASFTDSVLQIPAEYNGKPVTGVDFCTLIYSESVLMAGLDSETVLPACVTEIRYPATVKVIGSSGSSGAPDYSHITAVSLPEGLEYIGKLVLNHAAITELTVPSTVKHIGYLAFASCNRLGTLNLRCKEAETDDTSFLGVTAYDSMMGWDGPVGPDWDCRYSDESGVGLFLAGSGTFHGSVLRIPETYRGFYLNGILAEAFRDCTFLEEVYISCIAGGARGDSDGDRVFSGCTNLKKVVFGNFGTSLFRGFGSGYFAGCTSLESVTLPDFDFVEYALPEDMFSGCTSLKEIVFPHTKEEWNKLIKVGNNRNAIPAGVVVHCTDGDLVRETNATVFTVLP